MLMRSFSLMFLILLIVGCTHPPAKVLMPAKADIRKLPTFNRVIINGNISAKLKTGSPKSQVILRGDARELPAITTAVVNNTLLIKVVGIPQYGTIHAEIRTRHLNSIVYKGKGTIVGNKLNSGLLDISIDNPGKTTLKGKFRVRSLKVKGGGDVRIDGISAQNLNIKITDKSKVRLSGMVNLRSVDVSGDGFFGLYWIKSNILTIRGRDCSVIQLAGIVDRLDVELWGESRFNGRYLRARRVFAKTHNKSVAEITAIKRQHTLATDASDIYFYKIPETRTDFMAFDGSVLDMRSWPMFIDDNEQYTRYNKL